uniref:Ig-like domain-containing protein n=1 Tax=Varanus komodoensis TaxID=61221 RepID=A0A8D2L7Q9_VARKO
LHLHLHPYLIIFSNDPLGTAGQSVDQTKGTVTVSEGDPVRLNCTYQSAAYVFWYTQHPGHPPKLLLSWSSTGEVEGFNAKHDSQKKTYHLEKSAIQLRDSTVYFCAASDTVNLCRGAAHQEPAKRKNPQGTSLWLSLFGPCSRLASQPRRRLKSLQEVGRNIYSMLVSHPLQIPTSIPTQTSLQFVSLALPSF